jgi:hypothetical protein
MASSRTATFSQIPPHQPSGTAHREIHSPIPWNYGCEADDDGACPSSSVDQRGVKGLHDEDGEPVCSFERGGVLRMEGEEREQGVPATIMNRATVIRMKRKASNEQIEKFRRSDRAACHDLKRKLRRWAEDNLNTLASKVRDHSAH